MTHSKNLVTVNDANFEQEVKKSDIPVLVDFWAPWCGPCRMVAPVVEELADEFAGRFKVTKLNTDENMDTAMEYGIRSIPTLGIFRDGKLVDAIIGAHPKAVLKSRMEQHLPRVSAN